MPIAAYACRRCGRPLSALTCPTCGPKTVLTTRVRELTDAERRQLEEDAREVPPTNRGLDGPGQSAGHRGPRFHR